MRTIRKTVLLAIVAASMTSCAGIYRSLELDCENGREKPNQGIHFDIDTSCETN